MLAPASGEPSVVAQSDFSDEAMHDEHIQLAAEFLADAITHRKDEKSSLDEIISAYGLKGNDVELVRARASALLLTPATKKEPSLTIVDQKAA